MRRILLTAVAALGMFAMTAKAGFTTVNPTPAMYGPEDSISEILSHQFGGTFLANGADFTNGTITAHRVDDNDDQIISSGRLDSAQTIAAFSAAAQTFGVFMGTNGGAFDQLFAVSGYGYNVTGAVSNLNLPGSLRLARGGGGSTWSSQNSDNTDLTDHMVSYQMSGGNFALPTHMVFFEDMGVKHGDMDYNDLAIMITERPTPPPAVPLPAGLVPGLITLGGGFIARKKARRLLV